MIITPRIGVTIAKANDVEFEPLSLSFSPESPEPSSPSWSPPLGLSPSSWSSLLFSFPVCVNSIGVYKFIWFPNSVNLNSWPIIFIR